MIILCSLLLLIVYIVVACIRFKGIPPSVSDTFYAPANMGYWFTIVLFVAGIGCTMGLLNATDGSNWQFISFLTGAGMLFVGAAPHFKESEHTIHFTGASFLLAGSQLWILLFGTPWIFLVWAFSILWYSRSTWLFWLELSAIASMLIQSILI